MIKLIKNNNKRCSASNINLTLYKMKSLLHTLFLFFGLFLITPNIMAQNEKEKLDTNGVTIIQDDRIPKLLATYAKTQPDGVPGYRVQIFFSAKKADALNLKTSFTEKFADYTVKVDYAVPYFKVLAGAFRTKFQAEKLLKMVKEKFPGAFIIQSNIPIEEIEFKD